MHTRRWLTGNRTQFCGPIMAGAAQAALAVKESKQEGRGRERQGEGTGYGMAWSHHRPQREKGTERF